MASTALHCKRQEPLAYQCRSLIEPAHARKQTVLPITYDPTRAALYTPAKRSTLFRAGQNYSVLELALEAARLAYVGAERSLSERERLTAALYSVGFGAPELFSDSATGAQGYGAYRADDGMALVAFRGTQPDDLFDLATTLQWHSVPWTESAGRVHAGFAQSARAVMPDVQKWLSITDSNRRTLILTGHSLGGAMATLIATVCRPDRLITLGSPRIGDQAFSATLAGIEHTRLVDCCDVVTMLPPKIPGYTHIAPMTYITRDGKLVADPSSDLVAEDRSKARAEYLTEHAWKSGNVLIRDLADHAPINYLRAFFS